MYITSVKEANFLPSIQPKSPYLGTLFWYEPMIPLHTTPVAPLPAMPLIDASQLDDMGDAMRQQATGILMF